MPMRRRMSIHCSTIPMAVANGEATPARVPFLAVTSLGEPFMVPMVSTIITTTTSSTEAIMVVTIILLVAIMASLARLVVEPACSTPLPAEARPSIAIRTEPVRRSSRMNLHYRLTHRKLQVTAEQPCHPRSVRRPLAIREHRLPVHHLHHSSISSTNNSSSNSTCFREDPPSLLVHRPAIAAPLFNSNINNISSRLPPPNNSNTSNLSRDNTLRQTNRTLSNLPNRSKLLPVDSQFNAPF